MLHPDEKKPNPLFQPELRPRRRTRLRWLAPLVIVSSSCLDRPVGTSVPVTTNVFSSQLTQTRVDKIDLLFMIDNSQSMSDKQKTLEAAVPDLVDRLVNPLCIDATGAAHPAAPAGQPCPEGQRREFAAVSDIHVAIVSSSLGSSGALDTCQTGPTNDRGHLVGSLPRAAFVNTNSSGFLAWNADSSLDDFKRDVQSLVRVVGEEGCGWEASLEAWYRFLIDPVPYSQLVRVPCFPGDEQANCIAPLTGEDGNLVVDETVLSQRTAFLRPDSLVAIVMLTDENDCSIQANGLGWLAGTLVTNNQRFDQFAGSAVCDENPNDRCCFSCFSEAPAGCEQARSTCDASASNSVNRLPPEQDASNLRCFDQKRRFGSDWLYPTARYVNALTELQLCPARNDLSVQDCPGALLENPLFASGRPKNNVFLAGIVGVPWQQIASPTDANGQQLGANDLRFKTAAELNEEDWLQMIGRQDDSPPLPPGSPWMQESFVPRPGVVEGGPNGREYNTNAPLTEIPSELQYACIYPLEQPRNCSDDGERNCDCESDRTDRPLCEEVPGVSEPGTIQYFAKAYPGLRQLSVLKEFGDNSIVASICAKNIQDPERPDYGYRPAVSSLVERLKEQLATRCLPRPLEVAEDGSIACSVMEARTTSNSCQCDEARGRFTPSATDAQAARLQLRTGNSSLCAPNDPGCQNVCLCEVQQITEGPELNDCQNALEPSVGEGFCYVADNAVQPVGNPELVAQCPATERQLLRFVGTPQPNGSVSIVQCVGRGLNEQ